MAFSKIHRLAVSWSTSKGRDTYGYNICRLDDSETGQRFKTFGGGYDMVGTVFADWFEAVYQSELQALFAKHAAQLQTYGATWWKTLPAFYGAFLRADGSIRLDGGYGFESIRKIVEACGFDVESSYNTRKRCTDAYYVQKKA